MKKRVYPIGDSYSNVTLVSTNIVDGKKVKNSEMIEASDKHLDLASKMVEEAEKSVLATQILLEQSKNHLRHSKMFLEACQMKKWNIHDFVPSEKCLDYTVAKENYKLKFEDLDDALDFLKNNLEYSFLEENINKEYERFVR